MWTAQASWGDTCVDCTSYLARHLCGLHKLPGATPVWTAQATWDDTCEDCTSYLG
ncbi:hypothetical protein DPMN_071978 [Dreissena polymorpha]|uniref:Uncharacterized protein n=1 Tax=Dreissena polymorpha TaxID=45954 RepID=A0A9D3Z5H6_DREPO|nr:hypothetical protein DPMN_071978 [Dreissena polymorpha]